MRHTYFVDSFAGVYIIIEIIIIIIIINQFWLPVYSTNYINSCKCRRKKHKLFILYTAFH